MNARGHAFIANVANGCIAREASAAGRTSTAPARSRLQRDLPRFIVQ